MRHNLAQVRVLVEKAVATGAKVRMSEMVVDFQLLEAGIAH
jgi:hypothetical protein